MDLRSLSRSHCARVSDTTKVAKANVPGAEVYAAVQSLYHELMPDKADCTSRSDFLGLENIERDRRPVDITDMISLIVGTATLEKSMCIDSPNHKVYASQSFDAFKKQESELKTELGRERGNPMLTKAKLASALRAAFCGGHADRNYFLIAATLHKVWDDYPCLRPFLPIVAKVVDNRASTRLEGGTPDNDNHAYVQMGPRSAFLQGKSGGLKAQEPEDEERIFVIDSHVLFPMIHRQSCSPFEIVKPAVIYDVNSPDRDTVPVSLLEELNRLTEGPAPQQVEGDCSIESNWVYARDDSIEERKMGWQLIHSYTDDTKMLTYTCNSHGIAIEVDMDSMSKNGLDLRKARMEVAGAALEKGGRSPIAGSPVRGAPTFGTRDADSSSSEDSTEDSNDEQRNMRGKVADLSRGRVVHRSTRAEEDAARKALRDAMQSRNPDTVTRVLNAAAMAGMSPDARVKLMIGASPQGAAAAVDVSPECLRAWADFLLGLDPDEKKAVLSGSVGAGSAGEHCLFIALRDGDNLSSIWIELIHSLPPDHGKALIEDLDKMARDSRVLYFRRDLEDRYEELAKALR